MNLEVRFTCLDGNYKLLVNDNSFVIETDIEYLTNKEGLIDDKFISLINKANINSWNNEYLNNIIEDAITYYVKYEDKEVKGIEGDWPYNFEYLIDAINLIDEEIEKLLN